MQKISAQLTVDWHIDVAQVNKVFQRMGDRKEIIASIITPAVLEVLKAATAKKQPRKLLLKGTI